MDIADLRKRVLRAIEGSRQAAAARRARTDTARAAYATFLEQVATPVFRQVASVLKAEGYGFQVHTPAEGLRLASNRHRDDYIELTLNTDGEAPRILARVSRTRGSHVTETEHAVGPGRDIETIDEDAVLEFLVEAIRPFVER